MQRERFLALSKVTGARLDPALNARYCELRHKRTLAQVVDGCQIR